MSSAYYRSLISEKKRELSNYQKRKKQLESIRSGFGTFDGDAEDVNRYCRKASSSMQSAVKISGGYHNPDELWGTMDGGTGDCELSSSNAYVVIEIRRVEEKIAELNASISSLNAALAREQARERAEAEARAKAKQK